LSEPVSTAVFLLPACNVVSCYAFFKGWLLPSLPPKSRLDTSVLFTYLLLGTLKCGLGCLPLDVAPLRAYVCLSLIKGVLKKSKGLGWPLT